MGQRGLGEQCHGFVERRQAVRCGEVHDRSDRGGCREDEEREPHACELSERAGTEKIFPFDLIPRIVSAAEWDWIERAPTLRTESEPKRRVAFLTRDQADILIASLPEKYRTPVRFALLTGLRRSNVFGLRWENVNLEKGTVIVHGDEAKAGERILVPLNSQAKALLEAMTHREGLVFGDLKRISPGTWATACKRVGVPWCRFHDLRHTWASWHAMAGTPMSVLQELGGWHSAEMVQRYAHLSPEHLAQAAERVQL